MRTNIVTELEVWVKQQELLLKNKGISLTDVDTNNFPFSISIVLESSSSVGNIICLKTYECDVLVIDKNSLEVSYTWARHFDKIPDFDKEFQEFFEKMS